MGFPTVTERIKAQALAGCAYTCIDDDGKIICIGGVTLMWKGVGAAWLLTSPIFPRNKIWVHRIIRDVVCEAIEVHKLHRVEALILEDHIVSQKWVNRLGFEEEGLLRKYDSSENNYYMFARIEG